MCTLAVYRHVSPLYPLVVVANRDEFLARPSAPPSLWPGDGGIVAGTDLVAGGTWLGCRRDGTGRVVGVLNRRPEATVLASGPGELSRGALCVDALRAQSVEDFVPTLNPQTVARYGGFSLFIADLRGALVVNNGAGTCRIDLPLGLSVLTNLDVNDSRCPRLTGAAARLAQVAPLLASGAEAEELVTSLASVQGSHQANGDDSPLSKTCIHAPNYGTRSSSMILVGSDGRVRYFHADGPPCSVPFSEVELGK